MTRLELRVYLQSWFCGCGDPEAACATLLRILRLHPAYEHRDELAALIPDEGARLLLLYRLDRDGLTEHGGSIGGAWLTDKGTAVRDALAREESDGFEALMQAACIHGYAWEDPEDADHVCVIGPDDLRRLDRVRFTTEHVEMGIQVPAGVKAWVHTPFRDRVMLHLDADLRDAYPSALQRLAGVAVTVDYGKVEKVADDAPVYVPPPPSATM